MVGRWYAQHVPTIALVKTVMHLDLLFFGGGGELCFCPFLLHNVFPIHSFYIMCFQSVD